MEIDDLFEKAANHARTFKSISEKEMLKLYGLYKQSKEGPCSQPKPHMFDFIGKAKWESWNSLRDLAQSEAKKNYIHLVKDIDPEWDEQNSSSSSAGGGGGLGISVSTMVRDSDDEINECEKTVFDWCKEGELDKIKYVINKDASVVDVKDDEQMTLLHWAVDHGHVDITSFLLQCNGCNINSQDSYLQTPLHYAVTCDHTSLAKLLVKHGADLQLTDSDGNTPSYYCDNDEMKKVFGI